MEDMYTKIDRQLVTQATQLDLMMDECYDAGDYNDLEREYRILLWGYNLSDASFVEDSNDGNPAKVIYEENGKFGIRETRWHMGLPAIYDKIGRFCHDDTDDDTDDETDDDTDDGMGYFLVYKDGKMGMIEIYDDINVIFDTIYDDINLIDSGFVLKKDDKYIYWNDGRASEPFDRIHVPHFAGWIKVCQDGEWGWLDGNLCFTPNLQNAHEYVLYDGRYGIIEEPHDASREKLNICSELDNRLSACQETDYGDAENIAKQYSATIFDNDSKTIFIQNNKYGVKDFLDFAIVPPEYDEIIFKSRFTAYGRKQDHWGIIIMDGIRIANPRIEFDKPPTSRVYGNWQEVQVNGKWGLYDPDYDKYIFKPVFDDLYVQEGYEHIVLKKDGKYGFYDGCFTVPCDYEDIWWGRTLSFVRFKKDGKWGYMDVNTNWVENIEKARIIAIKIP